MNAEKLINGTPAEQARAVQVAIESYSRSKDLTKAQEGVSYYNYEHDILNNRILYFNDDGELVEDTTASNIRIPHPFFTEQVDQKVHYLLGNPVQFNTEDENLREELKDYYNAQFQVVLRDALEGASIKGCEYIFQRTTADDRVTFQISDSMQTFPVLDENGETVAILRHYNKEVANAQGDNEWVTIAELWDREQVTFFKTDRGGVYHLDQTREMNPRPHVIGQMEEKLLGRAYGYIPFFKLANNKRETTDLQPIKDLIDDYDLMAAFLSNNLQDFAEAIYVVKGYPGQSLTELRKNLKNRKAVGVGPDGGVDVKTVTIPVEGRKLKLEIDRENIYKFGMAFDSAQVGDGNITNIVIKSRYSLLDLKANKAESRLRELLEWINNLVIADINRRKGSSYTPDQVEIVIDREMIINESDTATIEQARATARQVEMETLLAAAARLDDETILRAICDILELDYIEVQERLEEEEFTPLFNTASTPPNEGGAVNDQGATEPLE